jgi:hypothetical protein
MGFVGTVASADTQAVPQAAGATVAADSPPPSGDDTGGGLTPEQLAKEAQNPVGNVTVLPFQSNWNYGSGPFARMAYNLNFQPVFPIYLTPRLNLIVRTIFPMISAPSNAPPLVCASAAGCGSTFGIGDTQEQLFFAPRTKPGTLIWGVGPAFTLPTATPGSLGGGKYNTGLAAVALVMPGPWVIGVLTTQQWSVTGQQVQPNQSNFFVQPFINYNVKSGWAFGTSPGITASFTSPAIRSGRSRWAPVSPGRRGSTINR